MFTKSYQTEQHAKPFPDSHGWKVIRVIAPSTTMNERMRVFYCSKDPLEAVKLLRIAGMSPQVIYCPASFNQATKDLFSKYKDLSIGDLVDNAFINCFDYEIYIDPTNLNAGLILKFTGDGVNYTDKYEPADYIKGDPLLTFESIGTEDGNGIFIQEALRSTLTGVDYKAFKDLKEVLKRSDLAYGPKPPFYKLSMDGINNDALEKFLVRRNKWLERYLTDFITKRGEDTFHLLQVRSTVGLPNPKVGMKVFKGVKEVTGVAFYLD